MILTSKRLDELEARDQQDAYATLSYPDALERFAALWAEARVLQPDLGNDWEDDIGPDLAIARALNGRPPSR